MLTKFPFQWACIGLTAMIVAATVGIAAISDTQAQEGGKKRGKAAARIEQPNPETSNEESGAPTADGQPSTNERRGEPNNPDFVGLAGIGKEALAGLTRKPLQAARDRGMFPTGLTPQFADGVYCPGIDDGWAKDYTETRGREAMHGGIDIPAPRGTPVHAVAAGEVVYKALHDDDAQGIQIWLRHSPEDSGLPMWTYTQYTHLLELPDLPIGQRVRMGDAIGKTSNTGISGEEARTGGSSGKRGRNMADRRDALHFAVQYSDSSKYYRNERFLFPQDGWWMDPNAIYRKVPPFDSAAMKALPAEQKKIPIPYMLDDGTTVPADTKLIWPYFCSRTPLPPTRRNAR